MKKTNKSYPWIKIIFYKAGGKKNVIMGGKASYKRFYSKIKAVEFVKCHILVQYGKRIDVFGKNVMFYNDGTYTDKMEAANVLKAFIKEV